MAWRSGDRALVRGAEWQVVRSTTFPDCEALDVVGGPSAGARTFLLPFDRPRRPAARRLQVVSRRRWAHEVSTRILASFPYGGLRFCPSAIQLLPYQIEPALAVLRHGAVRVLVADDVGLGKTIEACLVVREVAKADSLSRILIVCPAGLRAQWAEELAALFQLRAIEAGAAWLRAATRDLPADVNPWSMPGIYLASIDFVKRPEALHPLEDVRWDLLVVDEAHGATPGSDRRVAVDALASKARRLILLSATPHSGDDEQFRTLCETGAGPGSPGLVFFRRSAGDTPLGARPVRRTALPVRLSEQERRAHRLLEEYTARILTRSIRRGDRGAELVATILRKRALSSAGSLARSVRRRLELLAQLPAAPAQLRLPLPDEDDEPDALLAVPGLDDDGEERDRLAVIADAAEAASEREGKIRVLLRLLGRAAEPAIIFSEYRDTAGRLSRVLAGHGHRVELLHGGLTHEDRRKAIASFAAGGSLLVATDAASEGLNLHHACRLVVHFELPWTPARLHQRCGRVNRIGQAKRVHEIALVGSDTAEQLVLVPLLHRASRSGAFSSASMVHQLTESRVAAHVLAGTPLKPSPPPELPPGVVAMNLREEAQVEVERLERLRRLDHARRARARGRPTPGAVPVVNIDGRRRPGPARLVIVLDLALRDSSGTRLEHDVTVVSLEIGGARWSRRPSALSAQVAGALDHARPHLSALVDPVVSTRLAAIHPLHEKAAKEANRRETEMARRMRSAARELVQAGLFDRRAMRAAKARATTGEMLVEEERARTMSVARPEGPMEGAYEVCAVLVGALR